MTTRIIDLSKFNTITSWNDIAKSVDGVILRVAFRGYGSGKISADSKFSEFAKSCNALKIPWGIYFMSSAITIDEARAEAEYSVKKAKEYNMPSYMPIFIDSEDVDGTSAVRRSDALSKSARTQIVKAFINVVNILGYKGGIYCSDSWTRDKLNWAEISGLGFNWLAKYGKNDGSVATVTAKPCHMHQFTSRASIPGVKGNCDLSYCYVDLISKAEEPKEEPTPQPNANGHVQINYKPQQTYKVLVDALNVRTKPREVNGKVVLGDKLGVVLKGRVLVNGATMRVADQIFMYIGTVNGKENWVCADNGNKAYIG